MVFRVLTLIERYVLSLSFGTYIEDRLSNGGLD